MRFAAFDSANPLNRAVAVITIDVTRNEHAPVFEQDSYQVNITQNFVLGELVLQVRAADTDDDVIRYAIVNSAAALEYFYIDPESGAVTLKRVLYDASPSQFELEVEARDQGFPEQRARVFARVMLLRDQFLPVFDETYNVDVNASLAPNSTAVLTVSATDEVKIKLFFQSYKF